MNTFRKLWTEKSVTDIFGAPVDKEKVLEYLRMCGVEMFRNRTPFYVRDLVMSYFNVSADEAEKLSANVVKELTENGILKKNTVHVTYDEKGVVVESHDDEDAEEEKKEKSFIEKAEGEIHSEEWDECVRDVQAKNPKGNASAICTSSLSEKSFKSQYQNLPYTKNLVKAAKEEVEKDIGIGFAGPTPNTLLARQDLEGHRKGQKDLSSMATESEEELKDGKGKVWDC